MNIKTPKSGENKHQADINMMMTNTASIIANIHEALTPFSLQSQLTQETNPACSRIIQLFLNMCEKKFISLTNKVNEIMEYSQQDDFSVKALINKNNNLQEDVMHLVNILAVSEERTRSDIIHDFANSIVTYAEHGYTPIVSQLSTMDKELSEIMLEGIFSKINTSFPKMHNLYSAEKSTITNNVIAMETLFSSKQGVVYKADELAQLITSTNHAIMKNIA